MRNLKLISASAGSGKTYRLTQELTNLIKTGQVAPNKIIATTFTIKAAEELKSRIRETLISEGKTQEANLLNEAMIGTINSVCLSLLKKFAFYAGESPRLETLEEDQTEILLREIVGQHVEDSNFLALAAKLSQDSSPYIGVPNDTILYMDDIEAIISKARSNQIEPNRLHEIGQYSVDQFFEAYTGIVRKNIREEAYDQLKTVINNINPENLPVTTREKYNKLVEIRGRFLRNEETYNDWRVLASHGLTDKHGPKQLLEQLKLTAGNLFDNATFQEDYSAYVKECFEIAEKSLQAYAQQKQALGLVDFTDQEALFYKLLNTNNLIGQTLAEEYDLVMVDEFQDVSPLQLSIFVKLTELIEKNVWVGDPKQCIYAFRGADPELMTKVLDEIPKDQKEDLLFSYRSRASLVNFTNSVFEGVFTVNSKLEAAPKSHTGRKEDEESLLGSPVQNWSIDYNGRKTKEQNYRALAEQLKNWIKSEPKIFDKQTQTYRNAQYGDLAILCRKNKNCRELGDALNKMGVPSVATGTGLRYEPEVILLIALLKLTIFPEDTLAKAEVLLHIKYNGNQSAMIDARMEADTPWEWEKDFSWWAELRSLSKIGVDLNVVHLLELLITRFDLGTLLAAWGNPAERMANINALITQAHLYIQQTRQLGIAASAPGFLNYIDRQNEYKKDELGVQKGNAVEVMTYHKSKGLEWPVVVLFDLNEGLKEAFYGVNMLPIQEWSIESPLENRSMVLNFKPFVNNAKHPSFQEVLECNPLWNDFANLQIEEEQRLMYVGMTRARDYLIMATVSGNSEYKVPKLVKESLDQSDITDGIHHWAIHPNYHDVVFEKTTIAPPQEEVQLEDLSVRQYFIPPKESKIEHHLGRITPSTLPPIESQIQLSIHSLHDRLYVDKSDVSDSLLGTVIHHIICGYQARIDDHQANRKMIESYLTEYELRDLIPLGWMEKAIEGLYQYFKDGHIQNELPLIGVMPDGKKVSGYIDMVVEKEGELILIDHKTFVEKEYNENTIQELSQSYSGQLALYKEVLQKTTGKPVNKVCIYYVFEGKLIEIL